MTVSFAIYLPLASAEPLVTGHPVQKITITSAIFPTTIPCNIGLITSFFT